MSQIRRFRGVILPTPGQVLVVVAAFCGVWLVGSEFRRLPERSVLVDPSDNPIDNLRAVEDLVEKGAAVVPELMAGLTAANPKARGYALYGLGRLGPAAASALDEVRARLGDSDPGVRARAIPAFAAISTKADEEAVIFARMLSDSQGPVREAAGRELQALWPAALKPVLAMLRSDVAAARSQALGIVRHPQASRPRELRTAVHEAVRELLNDPEPGIRIDALMALADWKVASPREIRELLRMNDPHGLPVALEGIKALGEDSSELLPEVLAVLDEHEMEHALPATDNGPPTALSAVLGVLSSMGTRARPAVPRLQRLFETCHADSRLTVARTLADVGAEKGELARILMPLIRGSNSRRSVSLEAGKLLIEVSPEAARSEVTRLVAEFRRGRRAIHKSDVHTLRALGREAGEAVDVLIPLLGSRDADLSLGAAQTLAQIGPAAAPAVPALLPLVENTRLPFAHRGAAAEALGNMGPAARRAVPALLRIINQPEPNRKPEFGGDTGEVWFRTAILSSLGSIGDDRPQVLSAVRSQLGSRFSNARVAALYALANLDRSPGVAADLAVHLDDDSVDVRAHAALAIGRLRLARNDAVGPLMQALADNDPYVRSAAAVALGQIGPAAGAAIPALRDALQTPAASMPNYRVPTASAYRMLRPLRIPEIDHLSVREAVHRAIACISPTAVDSTNDLADAIEVQRPLQRSIESRLAE